MAIPCKKCRRSEWYNWSPSLIHIKLHKPMVFGRGLPLFNLIWDHTMGMFNMDRGWKSIGHAGHRHDHGRRSVVVETLLVPLRVATDRQDVFFNAKGWWWPQWCLHGPWVSQIWVLYWTCGDAFGKKRCYYDLLLDQALVDGFYWEFLKFEAICYMVGYLDRLLRLSGIQCRGSGLRQESLDSFDGFGWVLHVSILKLDPIMQHCQTF